MFDKLIIMAAYFAHMLASQVLVSKHLNMTFSSSKAPTHFHPQTTSMLNYYSSNFVTALFTMPKVNMYIFFTQY